MKVKFIAKDERNTNLRLNKDYKVLSIDHIQSSAHDGYFEISFRVLNENGIAAQYSPSIFEIVDSNLDEDFVYSGFGYGSYELVPKSMSYSGFWEDFFDDDSKALTIFKTRFPEYKDEIF